MSDSFKATLADYEVCERKLAAVEQERDALRSELAEARRQVEVLCSKLVSEALLPSETSSGLLPVQAWREWSAQRAKEGVDESF
jgi:hypothetical protein